MTYLGLLGRILVGELVHHVQASSDLAFALPPLVGAGHVSRSVPLLFLLAGYFKVLRSI